MAQSRRMLVIHIAAVLLPCAIIGAVGYQWLRLEEDSLAQRSKEAAEAETVRLREELSRYLQSASQHIFQTYARALEQRARFQPPPAIPQPAITACLFSSGGALLYPNYEGVFQDSIRDYQAAVSSNREWQRAAARGETLSAQDKLPDAERTLQEALSTGDPPSLRAAQFLILGRMALLARKNDRVEPRANQVLDCCAETRDEYGLSSALYAAAQLAASWQMRGCLRSEWPALAERLRELLRKGIIGHPKDLYEISNLANPHRDLPGTAELVLEAEQAAERIRRQIEIGKRLEQWIRGVLPGWHQERNGHALVAIRDREAQQMGGLYAAEDGRVLVVIYAFEWVADWLQVQALARGTFDASLIQENRRPQPDTAWNAGLSADAPEFRIVLRPRQGDPLILQRRRALFGIGLGAAILLTLLVGYFALRDASRELKTAALRSSFISGVTHELKTPLTSLRLMAETLRLKRTRDPATADELLDAMVVESERLTRLIDNILSFSRIEGGTRTYRRVDIDLLAAVDEAVGRFRHILDQGGFNLIERRGEKPSYVHADPDALIQSLSNLLGNAIKYSGSSHEICLGVYRQGREAEVRITDRGIGISKSDLKHIFESYYRSSEAAKETAGAGLGLALVRHFAEAHRGRVTVASEPGKGSTFSLWLPVVPSGQGAAEHGVNAADVAGT